MAAGLVSITQSSGEDSRASPTTAITTAPSVPSIWSLHILCDVYNTDENGGDGAYAFKRSTFSFINSNDYAYYGQAPIKRIMLSIQDVNGYLERVPAECIYPEMPSWITAAPAVPGGYIKRPQLTNFMAEDAGCIGSFLKKLRSSNIFIIIRIQISFDITAVL